ncbi:hypothetical protein [Aquimarina mytili]|uniref:Uncharacterized protein n=1 Tax=Aquimarina mytili TaxID=874423 RepID=A0A937A694_9FLAO|nr:hypothetical protein [Aquimarina mytili]MBL0685069.1 hypothetical protein [Aquimarina mytili]
MRTLITIVVLFISISAIAQTEEQELQQKQQEKETKILRKLAIEKGIELQKELNLTINASKVVQKIVFDYSVKANKVLQSKVSAKEKSKNISNLIYFQNQELKKILTVDQFYQYLNMQNVNVAGF